MVTHPSRQAVLDATLERAAEQLGDIQPLVMQRFYQRFPEARAVFIAHGGDQYPMLEAYMVESTLYCVMTWLQRPAEVAMIIHSTLPHHAALDVAPEMFIGLLDSVLDVIASTIPPHDAVALALWREIDASLHGLTLPQCHAATC